MCGRPVVFRRGGYLLQIHFILRLSTDAKKSVDKDAGKDGVKRVGGTDLESEVAVDLPSEVLAGGETGDRSFVENRAGVGIENRDDLGTALRSRP
jgi:hypothetical protein